MLLVNILSTFLEINVLFVVLQLCGTNVLAGVLENKWKKNGLVFQIATPESHLTFYRLHQKMLAQPESETYFNFRDSKKFVLEKPTRTIYWPKESYFLYSGGKELG